MRLDDWSLVPAGEMTTLYRAEQARWRADLDWDTSDTCDALERARRNGRVPGFVARDADGAVNGWTYYLLHGSELQIGALVASSPATAAALLDGVLASPAATVAARTLFFAYPGAPGIAAALTARGFAVTAERYLMRALSAPAAASRPAAAVRPWRHEDLSGVAALFRAAYGGPDPARPFAPLDGADEWLAYVTQVVHTTGCGRFLPELTAVAAAADGTLDGAALVTRVSDTSAHLAQMAVAPAARGSGLGARLLDSVLDGAARAGYARLSLLVNAANTRAQHLYAAAGFTACGEFVSATRPRQSTAKFRAPAA